MAKPLNASLVKMALGLIGPENIKKVFKDVITSVLKFKQDFQLQEGEDEVIGILVEREGEIYFASATTDSENKIIRIENQTKATDLFEKYLNNI